jgi:hypothetical protein
MLRGLAERTPGAERMTGAAAEPSSGADPAAEFSALLRGLAEQTVGGGQGSGAPAADDEQVLQACVRSGTASCWITPSTRPDELPVCQGDHPPRWGCCSKRLLSLCMALRQDAHDS